MISKSKLCKSRLYRGVKPKNICLDFHEDVYLRISYDDGLELISTSTSRLVPHYVIGVDLL